MKFTKMHGAGNDYVYVNAFEESLPADLPSLSVAMSHRHFGIGADGLIVIHPSEIADARMQMFTADGCESEMWATVLVALLNMYTTMGFVEMNH